MKYIIFGLISNMFLINAYANEAYDLKILDLKYKTYKVRVLYEARGFCDVLFAPSVTISSENEIIELEIILQGYKHDLYCKRLKAWEDFDIKSFLENYLEKKPSLKISNQLKIYLPALKLQ